MYRSGIDWRASLAEHNVFAETCVVKGYILIRHLWSGIQYLECALQAA